jgi:hypothetical protein
MTQLNADPIPTPAAIIDAALLLKYEAIDQQKSPVSQKFVSSEPRHIESSTSSEKRIIKY